MSRLVTSGWTRFGHDPRRNNRAYPGAKTRALPPPRSRADHRPCQSDNGLREAQMRNSAALLHRSVVAAKDRWPLANRAKSLHDGDAGIMGVTSAAQVQLSGNQGAAFGSPHLLLDHTQFVSSQSAFCRAL